jgi:hypothetical protein
MRTENEQIGTPSLRRLHDAVEYTPGNDLALNARQRSTHRSQARFERDTGTLRRELNELARLILIHDVQQTELRAELSCEICRAIDSEVRSE